MADIAILVAEEYERRTRKPPSHSGGSSQGSDGDLISLTSVLVQKMKIRINGFQETGILRFEPKTQIAIQASNCFFSA